jgi:hypothetical protein
VPCTIPQINIGPSQMSTITEALALVGVSRLEISKEISINPITKFTQDEFALRHGEGARIEHQNEITDIDNFNTKKIPFTAWPLLVLNNISTLRGPEQDVLFLVEPSNNKDTPFPSIGESFDINVLGSFTHNGQTIDPGFTAAERIENPCNDWDLPQYASLAAARVALPSYIKKDKITGSVSVDNIFASIMVKIPDAGMSDVILHGGNSVTVVIKLPMNSATYDAEHAALEYFHAPKRSSERGPSEQSKAAFSYILDFSSQNIAFVDLFEKFPHMKDPENNPGMHPELVKLYKSLNQDHRKAYEGLRLAPAGVVMIGGGPGAGKTHFNVFTAIAAQSKRLYVTAPGKPPIYRRPKVLYLIDVNKPIDDVANRALAQSQRTGIKLNIVRMQGFPKEWKSGAWTSKDDSKSESEAERNDDGPDFTRRFLGESQLAEVSRNARNAARACKAPTLDEAAWKIYQEQKHGKYATITSMLETFHERGMNEDDGKVLRSHIYDLYRDVLEQIDFVATTPVAAAGSAFSKMFKPDLVILDEAPHARELTSLIPLAFFSPKAWIFTGDYRQTRPFVSSTGGKGAQTKGLMFNPYAEQLMMSTMERAEKEGAVPHSLLINHRAYGGLEKLPSILFYHGKMRSGHKDPLPSSTKHVRAFLQGFLQGGRIDENRLIIHLENAQEARSGNSFYNRENQEWIMKRVVELAQDPKFRSVDGQKPGRMMIISPYKAATAGYRAALRRLQPGIQVRVGVELKDRAEVRTVDVAQGHESDVVFVDMVRTTTPGFCDDPHRLCVGITRARQGEFILMNPAMRTKRICRQEVLTKFLAKLWDYYSNRNQIVIEPADPGQSSQQTGNFPC